MARRAKKILLRVHAQFRPDRARAWGTERDVWAGVRRLGWSVEVAAAARDNSGIMGVAYESNVLMMRADSPGTGGTTDGGACCDSANNAGSERGGQQGAKERSSARGGERPKRGHKKAEERDGAEGEEGGGEEGKAGETANREKRGDGRRGTRGLRTPALANVMPGLDCKKMTPRQRFMQGCSGACDYWAVLRWCYWRYRFSSAVGPVAITRRWLAPICRRAMAAGCPTPM